MGIAQVELGMIISPKKIDKKGTNRHIWHACEICGLERWVELYKGKPSSTKCSKCAHQNQPRRSSRWKGARYYASGGYIWISLHRDDFFYPMTTTGGLIPEHRYIMAKYLGRCLQRWEIIHHKNGIKDDNSLENLELTTNGSHSLEHNRGYRAGYSKGFSDGKDKRIEKLREKVTSLEAEIILLKTGFG